VIQKKVAADPIYVGDISGSIRAGKALHGFAAEDKRGVYRQVALSAYAEGRVGYGDFRGVEQNC